MIRPRTAWALRHPVAAAGRVVLRLERHPGLPVGRGARARRLLREVLHEHRRVLVVGPPHVVRQALPVATLDVVGTNPDDMSVTVVSEAFGPASLPRRWECVVVTETDAPDERLLAATQACLPGGIVVVFCTPAQESRVPPGTEFQHSARLRDVSVLVGRVAG